VPQFEDGAVVLLDSAREEDAGKVPPVATIRQSGFVFPQENQIPERSIQG
jgi:hypothetical protein